MTDDEQDEARLTLEMLVDGQCDDAEALCRLLAFIARPPPKPLPDDPGGLFSLLPPEPWTYWPLMRLEQAGLFECGVSERHGWLTEKGKLCLEFMLLHGTDMDEWPIACHGPDGTKFIKRKEI